MCLCGKWPVSSHQGQGCLPAPSLPDLCFLRLLPSALPPALANASWRPLCIGLTGRLAAGALSTSHPSVHRGNATNALSAESSEPGLVRGNACGLSPVPVPESFTGRLTARVTVSPVLRSEVHFPLGVDMRSFSHYRVSAIPEPSHGMLHRKR